MFSNFFYKYVYLYVYIAAITNIRVVTLPTNRTKQLPFVKTLKWLFLRNVLQEKSREKIEKKNS